MQVLNGYINNTREVTTKFGQKIVMDCVIGNREATVWRPAKDGFLLSIPSGTQAQFTCDSKGKYSLVDGSLKSGNSAVATDEPGDIVKAETVAVTETKARSKADSSIPPETKKAIAGYVQDLADLYGFCHQTASNINGLNDNDKRQVATTLFIATREKFNL